MFDRIPWPSAGRARGRAGRRRVAGWGVAFLVLTAPVSAADRAVAVTTQPDLAPGLAAMPQIEAPADDAERRLNTALKRLDGKVRTAAKQCKAEGGVHSSWERGVQVPMRGPRFLSLVINDNWFCGGAHPDTATMSIVYDLTTGAPVDWTTLLPPALTGTIALADGADGTKMVTLASKMLHTLYLAGYRPKSGDPKRDGDDADCRRAVTETNDGEPPAMMAWLDAGAGGLAVQFDLAHVVQACADPVVIPSPRCAGMAPSLVLTGAIEAARAAKPVR
ncbi:hypothetical protein ACRBEV_12195 [Methylobacterium phyllosphaerae]